ncbi:MAG: DUF58 domain-containing protein, partial [Deltaproteobacteria bacterium]|nr:DUF58 domain-containing protein [Deltaproteobacteria bacterium]
MMRNRYRVKITPSGYVYILITIVLSLGAANTGNNLLYLMTSLMLALMAMSGFISFMNFFFIEMSVTPPKEIFAGRPAPFKLRIHKKKGYSFFLRCDTAF